MKLFLDFVTEIFQKLHDLTFKNDQVNFDKFSLNFWFIFIINYLVKNSTSILISIPSPPLILEKKKSIFVNKSSSLSFLFRTLSFMNFTSLVYSQIRNTNLLVKCIRRHAILSYSLRKSNLPKMDSEDKSLPKIIFVLGAPG